MLVLTAAWTVANWMESRPEPAFGTRAYGVWWPSGVTVPDATALAGPADSQEGTPGSRRGASSPTATVLAAATLGELDTVLEHRRYLGGKEGDAELQSVITSALIARGYRDRRASDLLEAAESLSRQKVDAAGACNRVELWHHLGLSHRAARWAPSCPLILDQRLFAIDSSTGSSVRKNLSAEELHTVEEMITSGSREAALSRIRQHAAEWRGYLEGVALSEWAHPVPDNPRADQERRMAALAAEYHLAVGNPGPSLLVDELLRLSPPAIERAQRAIDAWQEAAKALAARHREIAERLLHTAREDAGDLPSLERLIDVSLASARYQFGDEIGMGQRAQVLRSSLPPGRYPWLTARCLWLEAVALQASGDWELSAARARRAGELFEALYEPSNAGFMGIVVAFDLEALNLQIEAEAAYVTALRQLAASGDRRLLATGLEAFGRQQARVGRPRFAVEIQREVLIQRLLEGEASFILEARTLLAEQLHEAGASEEATRIAQEVERKIAFLDSAGSRERLEVLLDHVRGEIEAERNPEEAVLRFGRFLGEPSNSSVHRAEAFLGRAKARLRLGEAQAAAEDLVSSLDEVVSQTDRTSDAAHATALLDQVRSTLDLLVPLLIREDPSGTTALRWIETLRIAQQYRSIGANPPAVQIPALPARSCATEYFVLESELLSWTRCGSGALRFRRVVVARAELVHEVGALQHALVRERREEARTRIQTLSGWLVAPLASDLGGAGVWAIVPDARLAQIPFGWLVLDPDSSAQARALDVRVATSLSEVSVGREDTQDPWRVLAVGNATAASSIDDTTLELPSAERDANAIVFRFGGLAMTRGAATFRAVAASIRDFDLFHFAGHVYASRSLAVPPTLQFAPTAEHPGGRIPASQIARLDARSVRLAVLAGCASARDTPRAVGGGAEIAHAFLVAGAGSVIGTLWDVEDRAASAATDFFYQRLGEGLAPAEALRATWRAGASGSAGLDLGTTAALQLTSNTIDGRWET